MTSPTAHQAFQPIPRLNEPLVDPPTGILTPPWYRLLITLWNRTGCNSGSNVDTQSAVYFSWDGALLTFYSVATNLFLGTVGTTVVVPGPPVPQSLSSSPFIYKATDPGALITSSGKIELSRNSGGTYYLVSLQGGSCPVQSGDWVRVSWTQSAPANCTFFPGI
jgi:hypothetical protein